MRLQIQKWGNSLALRIPKSFAEEARVKQGTVVGLSVEEGKLMALPVHRLRFSLSRLLSGVTEDSLHGEYDFGQIQEHWADETWSSH